ncbi:MAG: sugar ABC transporter permease YjfF [Anaerolineaceae bacterium]|jgi:simple sugar transport system permease protein|nr:sugar ABC transporter permease YjfF [Anaerolineaceae bacterium]
MTQHAKRFLRQYGSLLITFAVFVLVYFVGSRLYPTMQKPQVFFNLFINDSSLLLVSIGMTLVILTGGIDLSVGGVIALVSTASAALLQGGVSPFLVIPMMIALGILLGTMMGWIIQDLKVQPFIATLMGLFFTRGMAYIISLTSLPIKDQVYKTIALTPIYLPFFHKTYIYVTTLVGPIMLLVAIYLSFFTRFGRTIYAIGSNEQSAMLMGLPVRRTKIMVYAFSGFCSALGGIVFSMSLLAGYGQFASGMELDSIAAVVIGGTALTGGIGNVLGTLFGVLIHGTIVSVLQFNGTLSSWWTRIGIGILTLLAIGVQSLFYIRKKN